MADMETAILIVTIDKIVFATCLIVLN